MLPFDTIIELTLQAEQIHDRAVVTKVKGTVPYVLRHNLTVYSDTKGEKPVVMNGFFLVNERGDINQIKPDTKLAVSIAAGDIADYFTSEDDDHLYGDDTGQLRLEPSLRVMFARALVEIGASGVDRTTLSPDTQEHIDIAKRFLRDIKDCSIAGHNS